MSSPIITLNRLAFDHIVHIETLLWNRCDEEVRRQVGLPLGRLEVLRVIGEVEQCRVNDIATRLLITVGAASKLVDRLENAGHCHRHPNPDDRRSSVLTVTELGRTTLDETQRVMESLLTPYFAQIDLASLSAALTQIEHSVTGHFVGGLQASEET